MRITARRLAFVLLAAAACSSPHVTVDDPNAPPGLRGLKVLGCDSGLRAEFTVPLDPRSVTADTFRVEGATGVTSYDAADRAAIFRPDVPFVSDAPYVAVLGAALATESGVTLGEPVRWEFSCVDRTPPVVVSRDPLGDDASTLVHPVAGFSEALDEASISPDTVKLVGVPDANLVYDATKHTVTLVPRRPLYPGRTYTVLVSARVRDVAGNALGTDVTWSFHTRAPVDDWAVVPVTPPLPDAAPCDTPLSLRLSNDFDLDVAALSSAPVAIDGVPELSVSWDAVQRLLRVTPHSPLRPGGTYGVYATSALRDREGDQPFDDGALIVNIGVLASCDTPTVAEVGDAEAAIACDAATSVRFSQPMDPATTAAALHLSDLTLGGYDPAHALPVAATVTLSEDGRIATLQPASALVDGHRYLLAVEATATSASGAPIAKGGSWELFARCAP